MSTVVSSIAFTFSWLSVLTSTLVTSSPHAPAFNITLLTSFNAFFTVSGTNTVLNKLTPLFVAFNWPSFLYEISKWFSESGEGAATRSLLYQVSVFGPLYCQNHPCLSYPTKILFLLSL